MRRAHCPMTAAESDGNLLVIELGQQQIKELPLARGQTLLAGSEEEASRLSLHDHLFRSRAGIGPERIVGDGVGLVTTIAQLVADHVAGNRKEPADECGVLAARRQGGEGAHEDDLGGILGRFAIAQPHQGEAEDFVEIATIEQGVGLPIAPLLARATSSTSSTGSASVTRGAAAQRRLGLAVMLGVAFIGAPHPDDVVNTLETRTRQECHTGGVVLSPASVLLRWGGLDRHHDSCARQPSAPLTLTSGYDSWQTKVVTLFDMLRL